MKHDFKVGGFVKCINSGGSDRTLTRGRIYPVTKVTESLVYITNDQNRELDWFVYDRFVAVDELDQLLYKLNSLQKDREILLTKYLDQVVYDHKGAVTGVAQDTSGGLIDFSAGIWKRKPKKKVFEEFTTSNQYHVRIEDGCLVIGGRRISHALRVTRDVLQEMVEEGRGSYDVYGATRKGINCGEGTLPWEDADKLLKHLNDYLSDKE